MQKIQKKQNTNNNKQKTYKIHTQNKIHTTKQTK